MSHVGVNLGFGNLHEKLSDEEMYAGEVAISVLADHLGFDSLWSVEHHFDDYAMCPDNVVFLANIAGRTERIKLGTGAVILPWNSPLRVAEKMIMLDILSGGRAMFGMGRGLSRIEYAPFGIPMSESRERFDEAAAMILSALETGWIEGDGPFYPQPRTQLRPSPIGSFSDRVYCVAMSQDSIPSVVGLRAGLMSIPTRPVPDLMPMYNSYRENWLVGRLQNTVAQAFGHAPCVDTIRSISNAVITATRDISYQRCAANNALIDGPAPVTDDRPFPYLRAPSIPQVYLWTLAGIILISLIAVRVFGGPLRQGRPYVDLFFLGAAFMLLETRAVTGFALLFGTTWLVNAIVFAGVLVAVLLAVEATRALRRPLPRLVGYGALAVALAVAAAVPASWLLGLPLGWRLLASVSVAFLPIFMANVVFASRFADTADATTAFGVNLLGAMVGGCLEYTALVIGYPALIGLAAILYLCAFMTGRRTAGGTSPVERLLSAEPAG